MGGSAEGVNTERQVSGSTVFTLVERKGYISKNGGWHLVKVKVKNGGGGSSSENDSQTKLVNCQFSVSVRLSPLFLGKR